MTLLEIGLQLLGGVIAGGGALLAQRYLARHQESTRIAGKLFDERLTAFHELLVVLERYGDAMRRFGKSLREDLDEREPIDLKKFTAAVETTVGRFRLLIPDDVWRHITDFFVNDTKVLEDVLNSTAGDRHELGSAVLKAIDEKELFKLGDIVDAMARSLEIDAVEGRMREIVAPAESLLTMLPGRTRAKALPKPSEKS